MKIILPLLLLMAAQSHGQLKRANIIKIGVTSFKDVANILLDKGYQFKKIDSNYNIITTEPKNYSRKVGGMVQFNIRVKGDTAILTGFCGLKVSDFSDNPETGILKGKFEIENRGMKGSLMKESFDIMNDLAKHLGSGIVYTREQQ